MLGWVPQPHTETWKEQDMLLWFRRETKDGGFVHLPYDIRGAYLGSKIDWSSSGGNIEKYLQADILLEVCFHTLVLLTSDQWEWENENKSQSWLRTMNHGLPSLSFLKII